MGAIFDRNIIHPLTTNAKGANQHLMHPWLSDYWVVKYAVCTVIIMVCCKISHCKQTMSRCERFSTRAKQFHHKPQAGFSGGHGLWCHMSTPLPAARQSNMQMQTLSADCRYRIHRRRHQFLQNWYCWCRVCKMLRSWQLK